MRLWLFDAHIQWPLEPLGSSMVQKRDFVGSESIKIVYIENDHSLKLKELFERRKKNDWRLFDETFQLSHGSRALIHQLFSICCLSRLFLKVSHAAKKFSC